MLKGKWQACPLLLQAFGFINLVLWAGNLWFVFKETSFFAGAPPPQEKPADVQGQQGAYEQDPYASNQGGYQPNYSQEGYNQVSAAGGKEFNSFCLVWVRFTTQLLFVAHGMERVVQ